MLQFQIVCLSQQENHMDKYMIKTKTKIFYTLSIKMPFFSIKSVITKLVQVCVRIKQFHQTTPAHGYKSVAFISCRI